MFLEVQHGLQTLRSTIADGITLRWSTERPSALALMPVITPKVHSVALDLRLVQPLESLDAAHTVRLLGTKPGLNDGLRNERDIPQLTPIRPGHHHTLLPEPHEICPSSPVLLESNALWTVDDPSNDKVHHLVDGTQVLEIGIVVFGEDEVVDPLEGSTTERKKGTFLVLGEDDV